jgi:hypothetical protein
LPYTVQAEQVVFKASHAMLIPDSAQFGNAVGVFSFGSSFSLECFYMFAPLGKTI